MAANLINQLSTANTFQHWLNATETLISTVNLLTDGNGQSFYANTQLIIGGTSANVSLNVETGATINVTTGNVANITNVTTRNLVVTANVENLNVTNELFVGDDFTVYRETYLKGNTTISGDLTVSGNVILDAIGFDDLKVNGSATIANTLQVTETTTLSNVTITNNVATLNVTSQASFGANVNIANNLTVVGTTNLTGNLTVINANVTNTLVANNFVGDANTRIYNAIGEVQSEILAFSIALG